MGGRLNRGDNLVIVAALTLALVMAVGASATAAEPGGAPHAVAAKKKKKRKKKCNHRDQSPLFNALSCTRLSRTFSNEPPTPSDGEAYDFCRNHTYRFRKTGFGGDPGQSYVTTYRGRWKVLNSSSGSSGASGAIEYTVTEFRSVYADGTPAESQPSSVLSASVAFGPFGVDFAGGTFLRGKAPC